MSRADEPSDPDIREAARAIYERRLSLEEFQQFLASELSEDERREKQSLMDWFMRRYPTPEARLAYARRYARDVRKMRKRL